MADDLPKEFDLVVIGTGFTESCIAAAASRIGKTVLHLDSNEFYGGAWASFNLENLIALLEQGNFNDELRNATYKWHIPQSALFDEANKINDAETTTAKDDVEADNNKALTQHALLEQSRRFNLDLCPKILYAAGALVQLLISSNICRYAEFRAVDRVCTMFHEELLSVPCSRSDVFNSKHLNIVEKRLLMKVLNDCLVYGEEKHSDDEIAYSGKTFREYLADQKVTEKISTCIMQAIAMCNNEATFEMGMKRIQHFLRSLGRYGNTPFLFPMYGCGEIPQCFCRLCAVFGGIYCLKRPVDDIVINAVTNTATLVFGNNTTILTKHVVSSHGNLPAKFLQQNIDVHGYGALVNMISRGLLITSSPLGNEELNSGGGGVNLLRLVDGDKEAVLIQLSHYSGTCPKDYFIFQMTTTALSNEPAKDLEPFMAQIFNNKPHAPKSLFSAFFTLMGRNVDTAKIVDANIPIYCTAGPYYELDYDHSIENARDIFNKLYPDTEFLPRAPDPEEIVIDGEDPRALSEVSLPEDLRAQLQELERCAAEMEIDGGGGSSSNEHNESNDVPTQQLMDAE